MGTRGPVGKRDAQRRRRNKPDAPTVSTAGASGVVAPEPDPTWHPLALDWYTALAASGQSYYYEPSDWATARFVAHEMSEYLTAPKRNAMLFASLMSAMSSLLTTEGDRRRLRIELTKAPEASTDDGTDGDFANLFHRLTARTPGDAA